MLIAMVALALLTTAVVSLQAMRIKHLRMLLRSWKSTNENLREASSGLIADREEIIAELIESHKHEVAELEKQRDACREKFRKANAAEHRCRQRVGELEKELARKEHDETNHG